MRTVIAPSVHATVLASLSGPAGEQQRIHWSPCARLADPTRLGPADPTPLTHDFAPLRARLARPNNDQACWGPRIDPGRRHPMDTLEKHITACIAQGRSVPRSIAERARDVIEFEALMRQRAFNRN